MTEKQPSESFARALRAARKAKRLDQRALGRRIGREHPTISDWETGKSLPRSEDVVEKCEQALELAEGSLVGPWEADCWERDRHSADVADEGENTLQLVVLNSSGEPVSVDSDLPARVDPGSQVVVHLGVRNLGHAVDTIELWVSGCPADWVTRPPAVNLYPDPDQVQRLELTLRPPRGMTAQPGTYDIQVRACCLNSPAVVSNLVRQRLWVTPYSDPEVAVRPEALAQRQCRTRLLRRTNARFEVAVTNNGNEPVDGTVNVTANGMSARVWPVTLWVAAGGVQASTVRLTPRRRLWFGAPQTHPVTLKIDWDRAESTFQVVEVVHRPLLSTRTRKLVATAAALLAVGLGSSDLKVWPGRPRAVPVVVGLGAPHDHEVMVPGVQPSIAAP